MRTERVAAILAVSALWGCGVSATAGPTWTGRRDVALQETVTIGTHAQRKSGAVVGLRLNTHVNDGLTLKSGAFHGGYDFILIPGWLALEPGADFGAGQPATHVYSGVGAYAGGTLVTRLRLTPGDREPGFNIAFPIVELTAGGHLGAWMPPEDSTTTRLYCDRGFDFGIRFAFGSDLVSPNQGGIWRGDPKPERSTAPAPSPPGTSPSGASQSGAAP